MVISFNEQLLLRMTAVYLYNCTCKTTGCKNKQTRSEIYDSVQFEVPARLVWWLDWWTDLWYITYPYPPYVITYSLQYAR